MSYLYPYQSIFNAHKFFSINSRKALDQIRVHQKILPILININIYYFNQSFISYLPTNPSKLLWNTLSQ